MAQLPIAEDPLTSRQVDVFNYLFETVRATERQPTVRAIARHVKPASPNGVKFHVIALQQKGCHDLRYGG